MTCGACPSQWEGKTVTNGDVYIRLRHGYFYLEVDNKTLFEGHPDGFDGVMGTDEMINYVNEYSGKVKILA